MSVEARTNVPYRPGLVVAFTVGGPGQTETSEPTTDTREPWAEDGFVGSLTVVPATSDTAELSVKIVLGIDRATEACTPPGYAGCIVARQRLRYFPHEPLRKTRAIPRTPRRTTRTRRSTAAPTTAARPAEGFRSSCSAPAAPRGSAISRPRIAATGTRILGGTCSGFAWGLRTCTPVP